MSTNVVPLRTKTDQREAAEDFAAITDLRRAIASLSRIQERHGFWVQRLIMDCSSVERTLSNQHNGLGGNNERDC